VVLSQITTHFLRRSARKIGRKFNLLFWRAFLYKISARHLLAQSVSEGGGPAINSELCLSDKARPSRPRGITV
jgi:hypothetical protein